MLFLDRPGEARHRWLFTQILPFYDERMVALYGAFERELYAGLA